MMRSSGALLAAIVCLLTVTAIPASSQTDTTRPPRDTAIGAPLDTSVLGSQPYVMTKSPGLATALSLIAGLYNTENLYHYSGAFPDSVEVVVLGAFLLGAGLVLRARSGGAG